jgi:hypothetical protein
MEAFLPNVAAAGRPAEPAAGPLAWHPDLVERLTADHWRVLALWQEALVRFATADFAGCVDALGRLHAAAREHHVLEQTRLFAYLEQELPADDARRAQLHALRLSWPGLRDALAQVTREVSTTTDPAERQALGRRLAALAETFQARFAEEESGPFVSYAPAWEFSLAL